MNEMTIALEYAVQISKIEYEHRTGKKCPEIKMSSLRSERGKGHEAIAKVVFYYFVYRHFDIPDKEVMQFLNKRSVNMKHYYRRICVEKAHETYLGKLVRDYEKKLVNYFVNHHELEY